MTDSDESDKLVVDTMDRSLDLNSRIRINISREKICEEEEHRLSKSSSRTSMLSKCSDDRHLSDCQETELACSPNNASIKSSSTEHLTEKPSRWSGIEVNPLYDVHNHKRRKSLSSRLFRQMSFSTHTDKSPNIFPKRVSRRLEETVQTAGLDDPDGILVTKSEFLEKWKSVPEKISEPYNIDTEENVIHYLAREGKLDVIKELFLELKKTPNFCLALKAKDRFGQTPMLSAINAPENRNEILKFFLEVILENKNDEELFKVAVFNSNKHNDTTLTLLMKNYDVFRDTIGLFFMIFCEYFNKREAQSEGFYNLICQILKPNSCEANAKSLSDIIHQLTIVDPSFFQEENYLFSYKNPKTKSNVLMELAKNAKDDALREILVNRQTYRHVTHRILQERNREGQTLLAIIEVNRVNLAESLPIVLKKEYGCHRRDILKTEQCLARQLESSMSASQIIMELNDLENSNSFSKRSKIWMILFVAWLCPSIGSTAVDIFFDSLLAIQYYHQYNNNSYVNKSIERCEECQMVFKSPVFNTTRSTIHCFEYCFSTEARLGYTLTFLLLPILFYLIEFLTLTDRYEVTTLRSKLKASLSQIYRSCCNPLNFLGAVFKFLAWLLITTVVIIFWQPITALFKFYRDGVYESATGNARVDARIRKRQSDLTASRGQLIEVNVESAFEPIVQGYIIFPNIIDIAEKVGKMVTIKQDGKVEVALEFTTVETAQLFSIITSIVSLAWNYSEYQSVKKNMLLDVTVSPFSRAIMFLYMIMHIIARLLAFQLFALFWGPGQLYPLVIFVVIHMFISSVVHVFFSEDLYYVRKGKYLKFIHNMLMNAFATIYFHNYLRMDEMPRLGPINQDAENDFGDAQRPGLHISTFTRQLAFDILYFIEFVVLLGCGFSAQIVKDGYLGLYTDKFIWVVTTMTIFALILKFFYYNVLHIWRNTIFTTTRLQNQPFTTGGSSNKFSEGVDQDQTDYRFVEYVFVSSNAWFLGKLKTIKTTIMILPKSLLTMIEGQGKQLEMGISNPIEAAKGEFSAIEQWKIKAQNLLHWKTTLALLCFLPLVVLGILVPLAILLVFVTALVLSLPLMILLLLYNFFGNCRNMIDKNMVDNEEYIDKDIEDLPPEIDSIENPIFSCDPTLTLRKVQDDLAEYESLDLASKPEMSIKELENITVLLLSLNHRRYKMKELNLNDSRLTDEKLKCLTPLIVRFKSVKIGGKQDYSKKGLEDLRVYMEKLIGPQPQLTGENEHVPLIKCEKIMLRQLEIKQSKSKKGVTDLTWVNEEVKGIEHEDEKTLMVNELANIVPYLKSLILDGFLRESAVKPMNTIIGKNRDTQFSHLWQKLNFVQHLEMLSLRDCGISDKILLKCLTGFCNVRMLDLSGNHDITSVGWKGLADTLVENKKSRLINLIYQNGKYAIDQQIGEQFAEMFPSLLRLDLSLCQITDEAVRIFLAALNEQSDPEFVPRLDRLDLSGCSFSEFAVEVFEDVNKKKGADLIVFKTHDATNDKDSRRSRCCLCCC